MTTKPTNTKTPEAEELKDTDLDKVQGGFTATDDLWKVKGKDPKGVSTTGLGSGRLKMDDPKKDD